MNEDHSAFVDGQRAKLIQRVSLVMPLADVLLSKKMLSQEAYSLIKAQRTSQDQMRELYRSLNSGGTAAKNAFYQALKKEDPYLTEELENQLKISTEMPDERPQSNISNKEEHVEDEKTLGGQCWNIISNKWRKKLQLLLDDPDRRKVGNEQFLMARKEEYKIGRGADGTVVYIGLKIVDGTEVAIKRMNKDNNEELKNEMSLLRDPKLESNHIVKYVDLAEDENFYYLALQLCEYNLDEYMDELRKKGEQDKLNALKEVAKDVLFGLQVLHKADVIHRDIKPRNVLIDVQGKARLADFGISRRLHDGKSTRYTSRAGTEGWEASEILAAGNGKCGYKKQTDIQVAGMLVHYILSDGHHPFGQHPLVETHIASGKYSLHNTIKENVEANDLIEGMINKDPKQRLTIEEAVEHPYFWDDNRRYMFLRKAGDENDVQHYKNQKKNQKLCDAVGQYTSFNRWKERIPPNSEAKSPPNSLPDDLLGLLRYLRNLFVHPPDNQPNNKFFEENKIFKEVFPNFYISAYKLAKEMGWEA